MSEVEEVLQELNKGIEDSLSSFRSDLKKLRTGRASVNILDGIRVEYYGSPTPLNQVAQLSVPEPRMITVKPFDKSLISDIERAINNSDVGITPMNDGEMIRLPIPPLNEERRKELVKQAKNRGEDARISLRNHRRDANEMLKDYEKEKMISEDELKRALEKVQDATDRGNKQVDEILHQKEKEILEI